MGRAYHITHNTTSNATKEFWEVPGDKFGVNINLYCQFHWFFKMKEHINGI